MRRKFAAAILLGSAGVIATCVAEGPGAGPSEAAKAYARCASYFEDPKPFTLDDRLESRLFKDVHFLLGTQEGPYYLNKLDRLSSVVYDCTRNVVYFLAVDPSRNYPTLYCRGDVDILEMGGLFCGNDPVFDFYGFQCDWIRPEGDNVVVRYRTPDDEEYSRHYGVEPGEWYVTRIKSGHPPVWPVPELAP